METALAEKRLTDFVKQAWHVVQPATPYIHGRHVDVISERLEAVKMGQIKRLVISIPPRFLKSLLTCVFFPSWYWIDQPAFGFLCSSYAMELTTRDAVRSRRLMASQWYQERWGDRWSWSGDQNVKSRYMNNAGGARISTATGATATGEGGDGLIVDDPHNIKDVESDIVRQDTIIWHDEVFSTRFNSPDAWEIVIAQRSHSDDLTAHLLEKGGWEHLRLPMRFEEDPKPFPVCKYDWRKEDGELLHPERYGEKEVAYRQEPMGAYAIAAQEQQRPHPRGGGQIQREWFKRVESISIPEGAQVSTVRYWDVAATSEAEARAKRTSPSFTVGVKMTRVQVGVGKETQALYYIEDVDRFRAGTQIVKMRIKRDALADGPHVAIYEEQEPGSAGKSVIRDRAELLDGYAYHGDKRTGSKHMMIELLASAAEMGRVMIVRGSWNKDFLDELEAYPKGNKDDQAVAAAGAYVKLSRHRPVEVEDDDVVIADSTVYTGYLQ